MIKVQTNRSLLANEVAVKIKQNRVQFIFDKYNSSSNLGLVLDNLNGSLDWRGVVKKIKGEFGVFIIKKKTKGKWGKLYAEVPEPEEDVTVSDIHERAQETLLSKEEHLQTNGEARPNGELTNELVEMMCNNEEPPQKVREASTSRKTMTRRKSKARSLVRNFKNIMNKYGNQSRKQLSRKNHSNFESNRPFGDRTASDMESFLQTENRVSGGQTPRKGHHSNSPSQLGFQRTDRLSKPSRSRSVSRSKTGNIRLSQMQKRSEHNGEGSTALASEKREGEVKKSVLTGKGDFKVLTIEDLMKRDQNSPLRRKLNGISRKKPGLKLISEISSQPLLKTEANPFKRIAKNNAPSMDPLPDITDAEVDKLQMQLKKHKASFPSKEDAVTRKSIYHQQVSNNYLKHLNKSRKSIRGIDLLTNAYRRVTRQQGKRLGASPEPPENAPSILEELNIEISTELPLVQNSSVFPSSRDNQLPLKKNLNAKSHRNVRTQRNRQKLRANKSNPKRGFRLDKQLRSIENSMKPKSVPKRNIPRSRSKPYHNKKKKSGKGSSVVFTKPKNNRRVQPKQRKISSKSAVHNRQRSSYQKPKELKGARDSAREELRQICEMSVVKKQEIFDTFAGLNLDMGWVHKQCRQMDLESGAGVQAFMEMQNRLIVKLATKLRKEKNSRYRVEQQCQSMMEKFSKKLL